MSKDQGTVRKERGPDQTKDKEQAQQPGLKEQREAAATQPPFPGEPAEGK